MNKLREGGSPCGDTGDAINAGSETILSAKNFLSQRIILKINESKSLSSRARFWLLWIHAATLGIAVLWTATLGPGHSAYLLTDAGQ